LRQYGFPEAVIDSVQEDKLGASQERGHGNSGTRGGDVGRMQGRNEGRASHTRMNSVRRDGKYGGRGLSPKDRKHGARDLSQQDRKHVGKSDQLSDSEFRRHSQEL
jgi:hypothetical protein